MTNKCQNIVNNMSKSASLGCDLVVIWLQNVRLV